MVDRTADFTALARAAAGSGAAASGTATSQRVHGGAAVELQQRLRTAQASTRQSLKDIMQLLLQGAARTRLAAAALQPVPPLPAAAPLRLRHAPHRRQAAAEATENAQRQCQQLLQQYSQQLQQLESELQRLGDSLGHQLVAHHTGVLRILQQARLRLAHQLNQQQLAHKRQQQLWRAARELDLSLLAYELDTAPATTSLSQGRRSSKDGRRTSGELPTAPLSARSDNQGATDAEDDQPAASETDKARPSGLDSSKAKRHSAAAAAAEKDMTVKPSHQSLRQRHKTAATPGPEAKASAAARAQADAESWASAVSLAEHAPEQQRLAMVREARVVEERMHGMAHEVRKAETTMRDLIEMSRQLAAHLAVQDEKIAQVQDDTDSAVENVEAGNKELALALKYNRDFRWAMLLVFLLLSFSLLLLDFIS